MVEADFPRGGAVKRERSDGGSSVSKKKKAEPKADLNEVFYKNKEESVAGKLPRYVELLKFKTLSVGMKLWGAVAEVSARDLVISLPHGLKGFVAPAEASDALAAQLAELDSDDSDLSDDEDTPAKPGKRKPATSTAASLADTFRVGQLVCCVVTALAKEAGGKKAARIELSLRLSKLHAGMALNHLQPGTHVPAVVSSVEDHGLIVSFGIAGVSGFLVAADAAALAKAAGVKALAAGAQVQCKVSKVDKKRKLVTVVAASNTEPLKEADGLTLAALMPGTLVAARVQAVLPDGLLLNFLSCFTGTVDWFHLTEQLPTREWAAAYSDKQRLNARILYVDSVLKRVGLTLSPALVKGGPLPPPLPTGSVVQQAKVCRIDPGMGMLMRASAVVDGKTLARTAYVHISEASDERVDKLEKSFKPGQQVPGRIVGQRLMDGLGMMSLKTTVVEQEIFTYDDAWPGRVVKGTIVQVEEWGVLLKLSESIKALCPLSHLSDAPRSKMSAKFVAGTRLKVRILEADASRRRVTVTAKKTLLNSKLPIVSTAGTAPGTVTHGYVTGLEHYGVFVSFYGGRKGLARLADLGLAQDQTPNDAFALHQVVKAKVLGADPNKGGRLRLSLDAGAVGASTADEAAAAAAFELGDVVTGRVAAAVPTAADGPLDVLIQREDGSGAEVRALLDAAHLSDHPAAAAVLRAALAPGTPLGRLVVLERRDAAGGGAGWRVSRKASLVASGSETPAALSQLKVGAVHAGYVASVTDAGCFVRFLGRLTGLAPVPQLADTFVTDPKQHFAPGQSVHAAVLDVDEGRQRVMLSLKPSACGGGGASGAALLGTLLADLETAHTLNPTADASLDASLAIGAVVEGTVSDVKEYGVLVNLAAHAELVGFAALHQARDGLKPGEKVSALVLDVSKAEGIVDLSLRSQLLPEKSSKSTKKRKSAGLAEGEEVAAEVELVKEEYLVVTLPQHGNTLAVLPTKDWNLRLVDVHAAFQPRQRIAAVVHATASPSTGHRLLLAAKEAAGASKRQAGDDADKGRKKGRPAAEELVGTVVAGTVAAVKATHLDVTLSNRWRARVHITEAALLPTDAGLAAKFAVGDPLEAEVLGVAQASDGSNTGALELTRRISGDGEAAARPSLEALAPGDALGPCFVQQVGADFLWAALSPTLRARVFVLDAADDVATLQHFGSHFKPGQRLDGATVLARDLARRTLDLTLRKDGGAKLKVGAVVPGRVTKLLPGVGLNVQLGARKFGRVHLTDIRDVWTDAPLQGVTEGQFVRCAVAHAGDKIDLSLRASRGGCEAGGAALKKKKGAKKAADSEAAPEVTSSSSLAVGMVVHGYVKSASSRGLFVALSRNVDAYARLCNLADTFVAEPSSSFPAGKLVQARVLSVDGRGRVEVTLKMDQPVGVAAGGALAEARAAAVAALDVGQTVWGDVRKIERFGVFVQLDGPGAVSGLCHISELADEFVKDAAAVVQPGERVRARVLRVDQEKGKVYLGLKPSYFEGEGGVDPKGVNSKTTFDDDDEDGSDEHGSSESEEEEEAVGMQGGGNESDDNDSSSEEEEEEGEGEEDEAPKLKSMAAAAPVADDAMDWEDEVTRALTGEAANSAAGEAAEDGAATKKSKREKKRAKEEREAMVAAAEKARLHGDSAPASVEEFEKALLTAGNSSFVWIKWLAWHVSRSEVEKARAVAEKALATIHYREDAERQNVWLAYLNLENLYGLPTPAEAVAALFQRAVQATDGKKLHLAVAAMYERTTQPEAAEALLKAACRKYSGSAKVWLRHVQHLLTTNKGAAAKAVMDRSLQSLPKRKHIKVISQTALLEFKMGDAERGRSIMEGVLRNFPRRTDLWSVYLDQEVKLGDTARARALFERAVSLSLPPRKMKPLFKKWLDFEGTHGDAASVERVKQAALAFAEQNL